jgi:hypothetical protein
MWAGFWVNALSGLALFVADATTKGTTVVFMAKLGIIGAALVVLVLTRRVVYGSGHEIATASLKSRALAAVSLALWFAAIATGRYMAYV